MRIRAIILNRYGLISVIILAFAVVVMYRIFTLQTINNQRWKQIEKNLNNLKILEQPIRGNICAEDGSILATSVPAYYVRIDLAAPGVKKVFDSQCDSLAFYLSRFFKDKSVSEYSRRLRKEYRRGNRGLLITPRKVDYSELQEIKRFPILRRGKFGGGMIIEQENQRVNPLGMLARRTIGSLNKGAYEEIRVPVGYNGLEKAFDAELRGEPGLSYKQNISGRWVKRTKVKPKDGMDVVTTINVKFQDIVETALLRQCEISRPEWATAVLMEVKTGEIKAIANLGLGSSGYYEKDNYAVGYRGSYEPGSTFKLVSLMVALEDGVVDTSDVFDTGNGYWAAENISDDHPCGRINVKQILEQSSNIGTAKVILSNYRTNPKKYVDRIYSFGIHKPLGIELQGEGKPYIKYPGNADWWGSTTLSRMSYGYDLKLTPLQILTFYNAVANGGVMVKPRFVKELRDNGILKRRFDVEILNPMIASKETIRKAQAMLRGVCEHGTGRGVQGENFKVAGKTGTARVARSDGKGYEPGAYYASFVGYFPADDPQYSLIVTFKKPRNSIYGASVAGPVFKEISEKVYAMRLMEPRLEELPGPVNCPPIKKGYSEDILTVVDWLDLETVKGKPESLIAASSREDDRVVLKDQLYSAGRVPDLTGMNASDAVFVLERQGLRVKVNGIGKVKRQSLAPGTQIRKGQTIYLQLL